MLTPHCHQALAEREGLLFLETSALSGDHVVEAFEQTIRHIYNLTATSRPSEEVPEPAVPLPEGVAIDLSEHRQATAERQGRSGCCG